MSYKLILLENPIIVSSETINSNDYGYCLFDNSIFKCKNFEKNNKSKNSLKIIAGLSDLLLIDYNGLEDKFGIEYDYDKVGELFIETAQKEFNKKHGYWLDIKEKNIKEYLYYSNYEISSNFIEFSYGEHTSHDQPYSVTIQLPLYDISYPILKFKNKKYTYSLEEMRNFSTWLEENYRRSKGGWYHIGDFYKNNKPVKTEFLMEEYIKYLSQPKEFNINIEIKENKIIILN